MDITKARLIAELCVIMDVADRDILDQDENGIIYTAKSLIADAKYASEDYNTKDVQVVLWVAKHVESAVLA